MQKYQTNRLLKNWKPHSSKSCEISDKNLKKCKNPEQWTTVQDQHLLRIYISSTPLETKRVSNNFGS